MILIGRELPVRPKGVVMSIFGSTGNQLTSSKAAGVDYAGEALLIVTIRIINVTIFISVYNTQSTVGYEIIICLNAVHESWPRHCRKTTQLLSIPL